jgi:hypothetical protein
MRRGDADERRRVQGRKSRTWGSTYGGSQLVPMTRRILPHSWVDRRWTRPVPFLVARELCVRNSLLYPVTRKCSIATAPKLSEIVCAVGRYALVHTSTSSRFGERKRGVNLRDPNPLHNCRGRNGLDSPADLNLILCRAKTGRGGRPRRIHKYQVQVSISRGRRSFRMQLGFRTGIQKPFGRVPP